MPLNVTPVAVNSSGSRNDAGTAIPRTQAVSAYKGRTQLVVDGVPYKKVEGCKAIKLDGERCALPVRGSQQRKVGRCFRHLPKESDA